MDVDATYEGSGDSIIYPLVGGDIYGEVVHDDEGGNCTVPLTPSSTASPTEQ